MFGGFNFRFEIESKKKMFQQGIVCVFFNKFTEKLSDFVLGKQPVGISSQDRLMSTSYRYEINTGSNKNSALRMQETAQVRIDELSLRKTLELF